MSSNLAGRAIFPIFYGRIGNERALSIDVFVRTLRQLDVGNLLVTLDVTDSKDSSDVSSP